jgi:hypothetical protein
LLDRVGIPQIDDDTSLYDEFADLLVLQCRYDKGAELEVLSQNHISCRHIETYLSIQRRLNG